MNSEQRPRRALFFRQLVAVSGWKGTLLLVIGSLGAALCGFILVHRVMQVVPPFNMYIGRVQSEQLEKMNVTDALETLENMYAGVKISTDEDFFKAAAYCTHFFLVMGAITLVMSFVQIFSWEHVIAANVEKLRMSFFMQALRLDMSWHEKLRKENDLNTRLSTDLERVRNNLGSKSSILIYSLACIMTTLVVVFQMHWIYGVINVISVVVTLLFTVVSGKLLLEQVEKEQENDRKIGSKTTEVLTTFKIVKSFAREEDEVDKFSKMLTTGREHSKRKHIICSTHSAFNVLALYAAITAFLCFGARLIDSRVMSPGHYYSGFFCVMLSSLASGNLVVIISEVVEAATSFSNLLSLMELKPEIDPFSGSGSQPESLSGDIFFENVTYSYPSRQNFKVLNELYLRIPKGHCVALVGPSGCGKSTIVDLMLRLFDPDSGKITIGGLDIRTMNINHLRKRIGLVMQEPVLFDGTIEENIRYGNLTASFEDVRNAAKLANADEFIGQLFEGYNTKVGERGSALSGGQKQRVAIARALVRDPDILLLDEATSALDMRSELVVQDALNKAMKGRTTIIIAHRLSTIKKADFICVLKDGQVYESGTHSSLMKEFGIYYSMLSSEEKEEEIHKSKLNEDDPAGKVTDEVARADTLNAEKPSVVRENRNGQRVNKKKSDSSNKKATNYKNYIRLFFREKSVLWFVFSVIGGFHCPCFCSTYFYWFIQSFKEPLHSGSAALFANGLNLIYFDVAVTIVFFVAILSASLAMDDTVDSLKLGLFRGILSRDFHFLDRCKANATELANVIIQKPGCIKDIAGSKASGAVSGISLITAAVIVSLANFWQLTLVQCVFFIAVIVVNYFQVKLKLKRQRSYNERLRIGSKRQNFGTASHLVAYRTNKLPDVFSLKKALLCKITVALTLLASECFDNIKTVHCLALQKEMVGRYMAIFDSSKEEFKDNIAYALSYALLNSTSFFFFATALAWGTKLATEGIWSIDYMFTNTYDFSVSFSMISVLIIYYQDFGRSQQAVMDSFDLEQTLNNGIHEAQAKPEINGAIKFMDLYFSYPSSPDQLVLRGFSLTVYPGQTIALVGRSGEGKSTIINLLEKFYFSDRGKIIVDGEDIRDINTRYLRDNMALVTQDPLLFNMTIRENILYGAKINREISEDFLVKCCKEANIYDFIMGLPKKFDTAVGVRGSQLSGGQRQRIAIARALVRNPKILLLDEATSALDPDSEKEVQDALDRATRGRTTIIVAHRLSNVRNADLIVVVENGRVREKGNHDELVSLRGKYFQMLLK